MKLETDNSNENKRTQTFVSVNRDALTRQQASLPSLFLSLSLPVSRVGINWNNKKEKKSDEERLSNRPGSGHREETASTPSRFFHKHRGYAIISSTGRARCERMQTRVCIYKKKKKRKRKKEE